MTELVNEQRTTVEVFDSVLLSPVEGLLPRTVTLRRQREGGRAKSQHVHQQRFIVALVSIADEAVLGGAAVDDRDIVYVLGRPAVCVAGNAVKRPLPVGAAKERVSGLADFTLGGRLRIKKHSHRQHPRQ